MRTQKLEGFIIKRTNLGEADRFLTVFTREHGKMSIKAKGVRRITSRRSSHIELLNLTSLTVYRGKGTPILTEAIVLDTFLHIKEDLQKIVYAYHICELLNGLCPENQELHDIYLLVKQLFAFSFMDKDIPDIVHQFEIDLLRKLGFWPYDRDLSLSQTSHIIENILERKLKSRQIIPKLL